MHCVSTFGQCNRWHNHIILRSKLIQIVYPVEQHLQKQGRKRILLLFVVMAGCYFSYAQNDPLYYTAGEDLSQKTAKYLFIKVETNKKEAFVGESIIAYYHLYVAVDIQGKLSKSPSFTGFASYDMEGGDANAYEVKKLAGIPFRVYLVKQVQLFGLRPGIQRLEPVELEASIRYRKIPLDINDFLPSSPQADTLINYTLKSAPVEINIKKLPEDPSGLFSGAVGEFEVNAYASANSLEAGKADTIHWLLNGSGNWHEIILPAMKWPDGADVFEPSGTENLNTYSVPVQGLRAMAYPVVFNKKGNYQVTPVSFTYFNPALGQYKTIQSDTIRITVTEAQNPDGTSITRKSTSLTSLFSKYAIIVFPITAITLLVLLFYRRKK